ncbi:MAG: helix-turn-helix domain-containing protein [Melioribacteraceae bacterium]|nr:helix-turn-helix domain-containing protein [Melioribacteraceae bacterium]MCF8353667.1 helix-turn-helix domain-containing protein [Melioribacteraceae bacterium]MCF8393437.1 helix-turn-helix domain-containing protein [Melioribacteraceae bacterium]MCF8419294.1 helix-turn-helix domain-containing protein [Melioribacteraceae bacterium]
MLEYSKIISYIFIIGAAQGFLLSVFLLKKKENQTANRLLGILMIIFAVDLLNGAAFLTGLIKYFPWSAGFSNSFPYLYGPMIYLYVKILTEGDDKFRSVYLLHFFPFVLVQLYGVFFFYFEGSEYQLSLLDFKTAAPWHIQLIGNLIPVHGVTYMILTVVESYRYNKKIKQSFSNIDKINLSWLRHFIAGTVVVWLIVVLAYLLNFIYGEQFQANVLIYITISFLLYSLGIKSLRQPQISFEPIEENIEKKSPQYKKTGLDEKIAKRILTSLNKLIEDEKPYLNSKLSLSELAEKLDVSTHNLSEVINTKLGKNFYDLINSYRIEEVKRMLKDAKYDNYSLLAIGYEAGFSSKSAYYSAFKKVTGSTPAQYKEITNAA